MSFFLSPETASPVPGKMKGGVALGASTLILFLCVRSVKMGLSTLALWASELLWPLHCCPSSSLCCSYQARFSAARREPTRLS